MKKLIYCWHYDKRIYVGQTVDLYKRAACHKSDSKDRSKTYHHRYLKSLLDSNIEPKWIVLEETDNADERECWWINYFRRIEKSKGWVLMNHRDGGGGIIFSDESKKKMSESQQKRWTQEERDKKSIELKEYFQTDKGKEQARRWSENHKGRRLPESAYVFTEAKLKSNQDPELRKKRAEGLSKVLADPEVKKRKSEWTKSGWETRRKNSKTHTDTINESSVREIRSRRDRGEKLKSISNYYGVSVTTISKICKRQTWDWVE